MVDEEAAAVVKRIFAMCAGGMGPAQIAKQLKKECIYSPSMYAYTKFGTSHSGLNAERPYNWTGDMVADMLQNMVYLGHTVNLRYSTKSYKDKKRCERPKSEWLIFENTHEELVDQETWDIVQEVRSHKRRRTNMDEQNEKEVKYSKHAPQKIHICFRDFNLNETDDMLLCGETTEKADSTIALPA